MLFFGGGGAVPPGRGTKGTNGARGLAAVADGKASAGIVDADGAAIGVVAVADAVTVATIVADGAGRAAAAGGAVPRIARNAMSPIAHTSATPSAATSAVMPPRRVSVGATSAADPS